MGWIYFLDIISRLLVKTDLPLMKNVLTTSAKTFLKPLGLTAASIAGASIQKKTFGSVTTTLAVLNKEVEDILKIVKSLEKARLQIKNIAKIIKNNTKEHRDGFLSTLIGSLGADLLGNMLADKGVIAESQRKE